MNIREFNYYQYLAEGGLVDPIVCFNDVEHGVLYANVGEGDEMYIFCLACDFKLYPGEEFANLVREKMKRALNDLFYKYE